MKGLSVSPRNHNRATNTMEILKCRKRCPCERRTRDFRTLLVILCVAGCHQMATRKRIRTQPSSGLRPANHSVINLITETYWRVLCLKCILLLYARFLPHRRSPSLQLFVGTSVDSRTISVAETISVVLISEI